VEAKDPAAVPAIDSRLEKVVLGMFDRCFADKKFKQALGIGLETRRLDKIEQAISGNFFLISRSSTSRF
jgi:26S proteasome regulatory subunit N2